MEVLRMPKINPEKEARRERRKELSEFLKNVGVTDVDEAKDLFKEMIRLLPR